MNRIFILLLLICCITAVCTGCASQDRPGNPMQDRDRVSQTEEYSGTSTPPGEAGGDHSGISLPDSFSPRSSPL
ncbi:MAG: hypothetical protein JXA08_03545 [Methanomicrobiaceae archaeon]|nr:hypothetical protein [Methanomicrobiaceae archaeon]